jgi:hypothetical protein
MLQLLDLARENTALKRELCRIHAEAAALQRVVAAIRQTWADRICATELCRVQLDALMREMPNFEQEGLEPNDRS